MEGSKGERRGKLDYFSALPEECISEIISLTSPRDACRSSAVSTGFRAGANSDSVWEKFLPSDYREIWEILTRSSSSSPSPSPLVCPNATKKQLYFSLSDFPILLDDGKMSFALDKETGKKCYMIGARQLNIAWGDTPMYWNWVSLPQSRFSQVAKLISVCWFDISGIIDTTMLSPNTTYSAYLVFSFGRDNYGLKSIPMKSSIKFLRLSGGDPPEALMEAIGTVYLQPPRRSRSVAAEPPPADGRVRRRRKDNNWWEIELGEFFSGDGGGEVVEMRLRETEILNWKRGVFVEGIEIRPKPDA